MKQLRLLSVTFDTPIAPQETLAFRGAIIEKVGLDRDYFHNHNNDENTKSNFYNRYPLIQYKRLGQRPCILFIDAGVEEAQYFFRQSDWELNFARRQYRASIADLRVRQYPLGVCEEDKSYRLHQWAALNQRNYEEFQALPDEAARHAMLERILVGQILGFGQGVGHRYQQRFELSITEIKKSRFIPFKGFGLLTFDILFKANVLLPPLIGLGRGAARGCGTLHPVRKRVAVPELRAQS